MTSQAILRCSASNKASLITSSQSWLIGNKLCSIWECICWREMSNNSLIILSIRCISFSMRLTGSISPVWWRTRAVESCKRVNGVFNSWEIDESRLCWFEIRLSIAIDILLKLCPTSRNSAGPWFTNSLSTLKFPNATLLAAFCKLVIGLTMVCVNHQSKGVVIIKVKSNKTQGWSSIYRKISCWPFALDTKNNSEAWSESPI